MAKDISFLQYMRAHGNTPGPTQRPLLTGAISGLLAEIPSLLILHYSGAVRSVALNFGLGFWPVITIGIGLMILAGVLYAAVFRRAANDRQGGWLFGISYGFLLWLLAPITIWQLITPRPAAVGIAAMGLFAAQIFYGLILGLIFPWIHKFLQLRLRDTPNTRSADHRIDKQSSHERADSHLRMQDSES